MSAEKTQEQLAVESNIPLSGNLIKTVITSFCQSPYKGDDSWEHCSIGIAHNSVVATDSQSAILIGEEADLHVATQRKEALLEAVRGSIYGDPVRLEQIDRNVDEKTGEAKPMPHVQAIIRKNLASMKPLAMVDPEALVAIGKAASAAGAVSVDLFQPEGDPSVLGFQFSFLPDSDHINLFSTWEGAIKARGVFRASSALSKSESTPQVEEDDVEVKAPEKSKKGKTVKLQIVASAAEEMPEPEPLPPVDVTIIVNRDGYDLPAIGMLSREDKEPVDTGGYEKQILSVLRENNVPGRIVATHAGPTVTLYELDVPAGPALKKVAGMGDQLQMQLAVKSVRLQAPIPGKKAIGLEIPNKKPRRVGIFDLCATHEFVGSKARLTMALGQDVAGEAVYADLATMPHLLIAGATNSGKSIGIASILCSLLMRNTPKDMRLILIDPKQVELSLFEKVPHLMCPVITDMKDAPGVLRAVWREMDRRYDLLKGKAVRNIDGYNEKVSFQDKMPYVVVVIDELADLMLTAGPEVETSIVRLAAKARAVGIHMILATQRPSVDVVTGLIKANVPSRIAFAVASRIDSQVILDQPGAEKLIGKGDMLFSPIDGGGHQTRVQGAYVSEDDVQTVCDYWSKQDAPGFVLDLDESEKERAPYDGEEDALYDQAVAFVREKGQASTSMLQRRFAIGFQRASNLLDTLEARGIVGPRAGPGPRTVIG